MGAFFKVLFRIILWIIVITLIVGIIYFAGIYFELSKTVMFGIGGGIITLVLAYVLLRRILTFRRRHAQIKSVVTLDSVAIHTHQADSTLIKNRWDRAISIIRATYLGRVGNPLYALPWYMVMGKSGSGKSSSIEFAGLRAMQTDVGSEGNSVSTRNCNWYFFNEAIIMDTAGRYAIPENDIVDNEEWEVFLTNLAKYRRKEPLNGLVLLISATTLYGEGAHLVNEARYLRMRIDQIMRTLGATFPVYLMISKIDMLPGMGQLLEHLPFEMRQQGMGTLIQESSKKNLVPVDVKIDNAMHDLLEYVRSFCLYGKKGNLTKPFSQEYAPFQLLAFEEFRAMLPSLKTYAKEIFMPNPYQEPPVLRGIFFSSALRNAEQKSSSFSALKNIISGAMSTTEAVGGVFLHDFYKKILPADRALPYPIAEYLRWKNSIRILSYTVFLCFTLGLGVLFSYCYNFTIKVLDTMPQQALISSHNTMAQSITNFETRFRNEAEIEKEISTPKAFLSDAIGFSQGIEAYEQYKMHLGNEFGRTILIKVFDYLREKQDSIKENTDSTEYFTYISSLIWLYDLVHGATVQHKSFEELLKIPAMPQTMMEALNVKHLPYLAPSLAYSITRRIATLGLDEKYTQRYLDNIKKTLAALPKINDFSIDWILHRASTLSNLPKITGADFWPEATQQGIKSITLDPVYTSQGLKVTLDYLNNINLILSDNSTHLSQDFLNKYSLQYINAWKKFALDFAEKAKEIALLPNSSYAAFNMSSEHNPFFDILIRMRKEIEVIRPYLASVPDWVDNLDVVVRSIALVTKTARKTEPTFIENLKLKTEKLVTETSANFNEDLRKRELRSQGLATEMEAYLESLKPLAAATSTNATAFNALKESFPSEKNPKAQQAPLNIAIAAANAMNAEVNPTPAIDSPVFALTKGPVKFFVDVLVNQTACEIQTLWEGTILSEAGKLVPSQLQQSLFGKDEGLVRRFSSGTLEPFLHSAINGYRPEIVSGHSIPFTNDFLEFLNTGIHDFRPAQKEYAITISALPVNVNDNATEIPYAVDLSLQCTTEKQELINYNSPTSLAFTWKEGGCGDTKLSIRFKGFTLDVLYIGENGFINFLEDFATGKKTFKASDFAKEAPQLKQIGVNSVEVKYSISGAGELLQSRKFTAKTLPFVITQCKK